MKKLYLAVCAGTIFAVAQWGAYAMTITVDRVPGYYYSDGGEFNISPVSGSGYDSSVIVNNRYGNPGYESFCMEVGENIAIPGTYSAYTSQFDDRGNALTIGTAYLYSQFVAGTLSGYDYADTTGGMSSGRAASAWALQNAIWYLQGENDSSHTTADEMTIGAAYIAIVDGLFTDPTVASDGGYGVGVVNPYIGSMQYQSQLYVPDGGVTAMLLGLALAVMGLVSRRWRLNR